MSDGCAILGGVPTGAGAIIVSNRLASIVKFASMLTTAEGYVGRSFVVKDDRTRPSNHVRVFGRDRVAKMRVDMRFFIATLDGP